MRSPIITAAALLALALCRGVDARCPNTRAVSCPSQPPRFRPVDGSCNNAADPTLGMANTPYSRILRQQYRDGVHAPREGGKGRPLPSPRRLVTELMPDKNVASLSTNQLVMNWAQLVSHDTARIQAPFPFPNSDCCSVANTTDSCTRVDVPADDTFFGRLGVRCIGVDRSASAPCKGAAHEQNNLVSHFLDASFVYGSSSATTQQLREGRGGLMRVRVIDREEFLPQDRGGNMQAGDGRVTITPMLAALQTLFLREHNRVARLLVSLNPRWSDERLFQEARRVVVAEWQLITYRDWLQWLIGTDTVQRSGLLPAQRSLSRDYNVTVDPSTANDFTTSAYRSFHSMIPNDIWFGGGGERVERRLLNSVGADAILSRTTFRRVVLGMVFQPRQEQDKFMADQITNKLFGGGNSFGGDLVSADIVRGREHGLATYNDYRARCNLSRATKWDDFRDTIDPKDIANMQRLYSHPDEVDFYVGGVLEQRSDSSPLATVTSPVFRCVVIDQFRRWKRGDRYFFDLSGPGAFSEAQLKELSKQTMSRLICDNVPTVRRIPSDAFLRVGVLGNKQVACSDLTRIDFSPWREATPQNEPETIESENEIE